MDGDLGAATLCRSLGQRRLLSPMSELRELCEERGGWSKQMKQGLVWLEQSWNKRITRYVWVECYMQADVLYLYANLVLVSETSSLSVRTLQKSFWPLPVERIT